MEERKELNEIIMRKVFCIFSSHLEKNVKLEVISYFK